MQNLQCGCVQCIVHALTCPLYLVVMHLICVAIQWGCVSKDLPPNIRATRCVWGLVGIQLVVKATEYYLLSCMAAL